MAALLAVTCTTKPQTNPWERPLKNTVTQRIVPALVTFETDAVALETKSDAFCVAPTSAVGLTELRAQWRTVSLSWNRVAIYRFGPLFDDLIFPAVIFIESMRQRGTDYTDTVREAVVAALTGSMPLDAAYFDGLTFNNGAARARGSAVRRDERDALDGGGRRAGRLPGAAAQV
ncbi:MAG: hypothetical protein JNK82_39130 [Myxococcaceae bacterium]|nr:hypothetical protein [Myxococcaceae bacterium]